MSTPADLNGRRVLITGAARGIGAECARALAGRGARLALVGVEPDRLEALAAELGGGATWHAADVRDTAAVHSAVDAAADALGGLDVVMANAGIVTIGTVKTIDPDAFERQVDVNLLGVWRTARAALPHLLASRGYLLNVASLAAALHAPLLASYSATKAGVEAFSDSLRLELTGTGVHVGVAYFGEIDTDMVRTARADPAVQEAVAGGGFDRFTRPVPVSRAVDGVVRGIERRARRVVVPRYLWPLILAPGLFERAFEAGARRQGIAEAVAIADAEGLEGRGASSERPALTD